MNITKFNISADGSLSLEGSEEFVREKMDEFSSHIKNLQAIEEPDAPPQKSTHESSPPDQKPVQHNTNNASLPDTSSLFHIEDEKVHVLKTLPGNSKTQKVFSAIMLLGYGNLKLKNQEKTLYNEIKELCIDNGCHDETNFSKSFAKKATNGLFLVDGKGADKTIKLTKPGVQKSEELVNSILSEDQRS